MAEEPFTFITELDDLPKDKLKCKGYIINCIVYTINFLFADMIHEEAIKFVCYFIIIVSIVRPYFLFIESHAYKPIYHCLI